jgi:hypothetical protein
VKYTYKSALLEYYENSRVSAVKIKSTGAPFQYGNIDKSTDKYYTFNIMKTINTDKLNMAVTTKIRPFIEEVSGSAHEGNLHSFYIVGSALTLDFDEKNSHINSVIVLNDMDLGFVEYLAPLGKRYKKKGVAAPLIMTPAYIDSSLDVFPVEFHDFRLIHETIFGEDLFVGLEIDAAHLRFQCEREIKTKLIGLRQGYISSLGDKRLLSKGLSESIPDYMPLFRAILTLLKKDAPVGRLDVIKSLEETTGIETGIFEKLLLLRRKQLSLSKEELTRSFEEYYEATERIAGIIDELTV